MHIVHALSLLVEGTSTTLFPILFSIFAYAIRCRCEHCEHKQLCIWHIVRVNVVRNAMTSMCGISLLTTEFIWIEAKMDYLLIKYAVHGA